MFVDPGAHIILVTVRTQLRAIAEGCPVVPVRRMTVRAGEHSLAHRMVRGEVEARCYIRVTLHAEGRGGIQVSGRPVLGLPNLMDLAIVRIMTVRAEQPRTLVLARPPG
jgi:hypothetical protein